MERLVWVWVAVTAWAWYQALSGRKKWLKPAGWLLVGLLVAYGAVSVRQPILGRSGLAWMKDNLGLALNPNYYFFGNHPRERVGWDEREMLPFWLLPFWLVGWFGWREKWLKMGKWLWMGPVLVLSILGHENAWGPVVMLPFLLVGIIKGGVLIWAKTRN